MNWFKTLISKPLSSTQFALVLTSIFLIFCNTAFFSAVGQIVDLHKFSDWVFILRLAIVAFAFTFIVLQILVLPYINKPIAIFLLIGAASASYFMNTYGIVIHQTMIQNMVETDTKEASELINGTLIAYLLILGIAPSIAVAFGKVSFQPFLKETWNKVKTIAIALVVIAAVIGVSTAEFASFFRNNKNVRQMLNPVNFVYAGLSYATHSNKSIVVKPIGEDAKLAARITNTAKPTLFILVVGETARADKFTLNGYNRPTTPLIAQQSVINFPAFYSCGTETAVSVPCMFSNLGREKYSDKKAKSQEGLLDVVQRAGYKVLWRDNNSGCKGTCARTLYEDMSNLKEPELCNDKECFDNILLHQLNEKIAPLEGNKLIVLHQKGSHGPDYYKRVPESAYAFTPVCKVNKLQDCSQEELVNAFDNTIHYTDGFLNNTINWLKSQSANYNTAMIYLSDHGESLGEKGLYLHGMPYVFAPQEQKHVPFFFWFSPEFEATFQIKRDCLTEKSTKEFSHDNLFHTTLGLLGVETSLYNKELDITNGCR